MRNEAWQVNGHSKRPTSLIIVNIPQMNTKSVFPGVALFTLRALVAFRVYCLHVHFIML